MPLAVLLLTVLLSSPASAQEKFDRETVIFIGSSTMGHWKPRMDRDFLPIPTWNFGENGTDFHYLHETVTDWAKKFPAKRWVIYSGDNDLNSQPPHTPAQVNDDMKKTVELIRAQDADAEIFVLSIKCRVYAEAEPVCPHVRETNKLMAESALKMEKVTYVDAFAAMEAAAKKTGEGMKSFFDEDGVHLNDQGYDIWRDALKPVLQKSIGKKKAAESAEPAPETPDSPEKPGSVSAN